MDSSDIAPMVVALALIFTTGGVIVLRPLTKRLGELLEVMTREKNTAGLEQDAARTREIIANMESRLSLLEERQSFTESLLDTRRLEGMERGARLSPGQEDVPHA